MSSHQIPSEPTTNTTNNPDELENAHVHKKRKISKLKDGSSVSKKNKTREHKTSPASSPAPDPSHLKNIELNALDDESKENDKHKRLLEKRQKSLRKTERIVAATTEANINIPEPVEVELHDLVPLPQPELVEQLLLPTSSSPQWLSTEIRVSSNTWAEFSAVGVPDDVAVGLKAAGFNDAFAVQAAVLPILLPGPGHLPGDILVSAATGSGKTLSYVLPMIHDISQSGVTRLRALIVIPTRELVLQAREVAETCAKICSGRGKRRVKIGVAVGSETFKAEQSHLMEESLRYDPVEYQRQQARCQSIWNGPDPEGEEEGMTKFEIELAAMLPDHVVESVPKIDILICTPGRLVEHLKSTLGFSLDYIKWLVVDEADKLLDQSFQQWLGTVMRKLDDRKLPKRCRVRKVVLSATMTRDLGKLSGLHLYRPKLVVLENASNREDSNNSQAHILPPLLYEAAIKVDDEGLKPLYLMELMDGQNIVPKIEQPISKAPLNASLNNDSSDSSESSDSAGSSQSSDLSDSDSSSDADSLADSDTEMKDTDIVKDMKDAENDRDVETPRGVLIFTKSNETALRLSRLIALLEPRYVNQVGTLTSTTRDTARKTSLNAFRAGRLSILVASDLVSRGLDLPNLAHVINYDIPTSQTSYVHRVGRTARAGREGSAWTLITKTEARWFWNDIARSNAIARPPKAKVYRVDIDFSIFENMKEKYEQALEELGREAAKPPKAASRS